MRRRIRLSPIVHATIGLFFFLDSSAIFSRPPKASGGYHPKRWR